ncbi:MAG TPA: hypothetical protein VIF82_15000 [Burkholderiaceae bacterium]|jgi:hypothetical protein
MLHIGIILAEADAMLSTFCAVLFYRFNREFDAVDVTIKIRRNEIADAITVDGIV